MRHSFHVLFASALVLGLCIVLNVHKSDHVTEVPDHPDFAQEKLLPACSIRSSADLLSFTGSMAPGLFKFDTGKPDRPEYQISRGSMIRGSIQRHIHMEIKPLLFMRSGQYFHSFRSLDDPALS